MFENDPEALVLGDPDKQRWLHQTIHSSHWRVLSHPVVMMIVAVLSVYRPENRRFHREQYRPSIQMFRELTVTKPLSLDWPPRSPSWQGSVTPTRTCFTRH